MVLATGTRGAPNLASHCDVSCERASFQPGQGWISLLISPRGAADTARRDTVTPYLSVTALRDGSLLRVFDGSQGMHGSQHRVAIMG